MEFFLDGWTFIDPSNNLRGGFEGSVIFTYSTMQCIDRWMLEQSALSSKMEWLIVSGHESSKTEKNFTVAENKLLAFFAEV